MNISKTIEIKCACGTSFIHEREQNEISDIFPNFGVPDKCPSCEASANLEMLRKLEERKIEAAKAREERKTGALAKMRLEWPANVPKIYSGTDIAHKSFNAAGWHRVSKWEPSEDHPWLGLIGTVGSCKSRIAVMLAEREHERQLASSFDADEPNPRSYYGKEKSRPEFYFTQAYRISEAAENIKIGSFDRKDRARDFLQYIANVDLLLIDDIGKMKSGEHIAAEWFALIDYRHSEKLTTIWTANNEPDEFAKIMGPQFADPFAGRFNSSSKIAKF
jgi:DNA replication protein DnaC